MTWPMRCRHRNRGVEQFSSANILSSKQATKEIWMLPSRWNLGSQSAVAQFFSHVVRSWIRDDQERRNNHPAAAYAAQCEAQVPRQDLLTRWRLNCQGLRVQTTCHLRSIP